MEVVPTLRWKRSSSSRAEARSLASRLERGSSRRKTAGSRTMARARATLCRSPPESSRGLRSRSAPMPRSDAPLDLFLVEFFFYVLGLQWKGDIFVDREVWIERVALKDHSDAAFTRGEIVDDLAADEDFAGRGRF